MKKIYFGCSISAGRDHAHVYQDIVDAIKDQGVQVLSEIFADKNIEAIKGPSPHLILTPNKIWQNDLGLLRKADAVIAEVTQPSFGVGYEIAKAHEWNKPVLALYHPRPGHRLSTMISGGPNVTVFEYEDVNETEVAITKFINKI